MSTTAIPPADLESFSKHLQASNRILALCGAGLSAASGLPTFRGAGGLWRNNDAVSLATPEAFARDPGLVWQFYSYRRHMALQADPNPAHYALAKLAKRNSTFLTLTQNVDGLSQRAHHPLSQLHLLHGSLFDIRCTSFYCNYTEQNNFTDPIVPALAIPQEPAPDGSGGLRDVDISDARAQIPKLPREQLPKCPHCHDGLLRPGVVWFGEMLPEVTIRAIEDFIDESEKIDLILVIGTSAKVFPAASYVERARDKGARVAVINTDRADTPGGAGGLVEGDWFFQGDAGVVLPEILKAVIGNLVQSALGQFPASQLQ